MIPIQQLLSRIRWDKEFGRGEFVLGYQDRFQDHVIHVPLRQVLDVADGSHALRLVSPEGEEITIPLHRVVEVLRDGQPIWQRRK